MTAMASSSNPFRKKSALPEEQRFPSLDPIDTSQAHAPPPRTSFPESRGHDDDDSNDDDDTDDYENAGKDEVNKASKPVKKVRIVSPPPLSPDSPEWPAAQMPDPTYGTYNVPPSAPPPDPFGGSVTDDSDRDASTPVAAAEPTPSPAAPAPPPPPPSQRSSGSAAPPNPFSKTLQDIENTKELEIQEREEGEVLKAANSTKQTLDVNAFQRLLMTGKANADDAPASNNKIQESSEVSENTQANKEKKIPPPPPPSSRHGKTLKAESKPVPEAPTKSQTESPNAAPEQPEEFSEEDTSTVSEDDSLNQAGVPASTATQPEQQPPGSARKPAPAPPPRRGHGRTDTKTNLPDASSLAEPTLKPADDDPPSRSSMDSIPTNTNTNTNTTAKPGSHAPAPPPPRRPHVTPKQTGMTSSPSVSSTSIPQRDPSSQSDAVLSPPLESSSKPSKAPARPPPPPARQSTSRRPISILGAENTPRKSSNEGRARDGSIGSGSVPPPPPPKPRVPGASPNDKSAQGNTTESNQVSQPQPGMGADILADLDALRREVDALRGQTD